MDLIFSEFSALPMAPKEETKTTGTLSHSHEINEYFHEEWRLSPASHHSSARRSVQIKRAEKQRNGEAASGYFLE